MRLTDCDDVVGKGNFFQYCFDEVDGVPLMRVVSGTHLDSYYIDRRMQYIINYAILESGKHMKLYVFRDRFSYGKLLKRYDKTKCVRIDVSNVKYDFDRNNGLLIITGDLPKNVTMDDFVVGDLRIANYEEFFVDCYTKQSLYDEMLL